MRTSTTWQQKEVPKKNRKGMYNVMRVEKTKNYTTVSNVHLMDETLSLKAKGLMTIMLALPNDEWELTINGLAQLSKDQKDAVSSALKELEQANYLVKKQRFDERNKFNGYDYTLYEVPYTDFPKTEFPKTENPTQLNTNILNTYSSPKISKSNKKSKSHINLDQANEMINQYSFSNSMYEEILQWFDYKIQRNEPYTEIGFKNFLTRLSNKIRAYGEQAVMDCIEETMSNEWKGVVWEKIKVTSQDEHNAFMEMWRNA